MPLGRYMKGKVQIAPIMRIRASADKGVLATAAVPNIALEARTGPATAVLFAYRAAATIPAAIKALKHLKVKL